MQVSQIIDQVYDKIKAWQNTCFNYYGPQVEYTEQLVQRIKLLEMLSFAFLFSCGLDCFFILRAGLPKMPEEHSAIGPT